MKQVLRLNTAYYELDAASKVLYVSQQIEFVVEKFMDRGVRGMGSSNFMNVETSARFERPRDGPSRRGSLDSEIHADSGRSRRRSSVQPRVGNSLSSGSLGSVK